MSCIPDKTHWRGAQIRREAFAAFTSLPPLFLNKANLVRWQHNVDDPDMIPVNIWNFTAKFLLDSEFDGIWPSCNGKGRTVISCQTYPGGLDVPTNRLYMFESNIGGKEAFIDFWRYAAQKYPNQKLVYVFDLARGIEGRLGEVRQLLKETIKEIRLLAPNKILTVTPPYGDPLRYKTMQVWPKFEPLWYTANMYYPMEFTHQALGYPGGVTWGNTKADKDKLRHHLRYMRKFQLKHGVRMYIGEVGVDVYADSVSRVNYLSQAISLFEEYGWNWSGVKWYDPTGNWNMESDPPTLAVYNKFWSKNTEV